MHWQLLESCPLNELHRFSLESQPRSNRNNRLVKKLQLPQPPSRDGQTRHQSCCRAKSSCRECITQGCRTDPAGAQVKLCSTNLQRLPPRPPSISCATSRQATRYAKHFASSVLLLSFISVRASAFFVLTHKKPLILVSLVKRCPPHTQRSKAIMGYHRGV